MKYGVVIRVTTMLAVAFALLAWTRLAPGLTCGLSMLFALLLAVPISMSGIESALYHRRAFTREYLIAGRWLDEMFHHRYSVLVWETAKALVLAMILLAAGPFLDVREWAFLFAFVLVMTGLMPRVYALLDGVVKEDYHYVLARRSLIWVSTMLLWLQSQMAIWFSDGRAFIGLRWQEVVSYGSQYPETECDLFTAIGRLIVIISDLSNWAVQNMTRIGEPAQAVVAWGFYVAGAALSMIVAWAFSRALIGVLARPVRLWREARAEARAAKSADD